uniref:NUDIX hydrolase n=1 Tax=Mimivirus LCMiAC02 TaxID=2506609 RepID=A0A4P6VPE9_9VIRU|nr:MAG: NUDIX hydrolase [Mimivirus LCMiAC02]
MAPDADYNSLIEYFVIPTSDIVFMSSDFKRTFLSRRANPPLKCQYWGLGGRLIKHETPYMAIYRILKDEGGFIVNDKTNKPQYVDTFCCNFDNVRGRSVSGLIHFFYIVVDDDLSLSYDNQHTKGQWLDCDDEQVHPMLKEVIRRVKKMEEKGSEAKSPTSTYSVLGTRDSTTFFVEHNSDWFSTIDYIGEVESRGKFNPRILPPKEIYEINKAIDYNNIKELDDHIKNMGQVINLEKNGKKKIIKELNRLTLIKNNIKAIDMAKENKIKKITQ